MTAWLAHVKKTMKSEAGKKKDMGKKWFSHVLKTAKKSYKKHHKGGEDKEEPIIDIPDVPVIEGSGKRRRRGGKTRRHRK
jgi:hypothetical protein